MRIGSVMHKKINSRRLMEIREMNGDRTWQWLGDDGDQGKGV